MSDYGEPPGGEPVGNGLDRNGHTTAALTRLGERTLALETRLTTLNDEIKHLPTKTTSIAIITIILAVIALVANSYWNGINGQFKGLSSEFDAVNARIDAVNVRLDSISKTLDRLQQPNPQQSPATPHGK